MSFYFSLINLTSVLAWDILLSAVNKYASKRWSLMEFYALILIGPVIFINRESVFMVPNPFPISQKAITDLTFNSWDFCPDCPGMLTSFDVFHPHSQHEMRLFVWPGFLFVSYILNTDFFRTAFYTTPIRSLN